MSAPSPDLVKTITDGFLIEKTALVPADLGFVFGNHHIPDLLAERAAQFYDDGYFPWIAVSGGVPVRSDGPTTEAETIAQALIRKGVPQDRIILETASTNTQENVEMTRPLIDAALGIGAVRTLIGFGHVAAGTRFLMTLKRRWPEVIAMHIAVNPFPVPLDHWHMHPEFRAAVLHEHAKIPGYLDVGFIEPVDFQALAEAIRTKAAPHQKP